MARPLDDPIDRLIAAALVGDGRSTLKQLADATGLSVSAVQARVRRLEADGIIHGYRALVDPEALGLPLAALIAITPLDHDHEHDVPDRLAGLTEIETCPSVAGEDSFVLWSRPTRVVAVDSSVVKRLHRKHSCTLRP
jgi:Lrp/AsnC family leucine-responsive transcriptional regulator